MTRNTTLKVSFFFSSRRRHTRSLRDWSSDVCSSDLRDRRTADAERGWQVDLTGQVALVTGAASGIRRASARAFAAAGAAVVTVDVDADRLAETCELIGSAGGTAEPVVADVTRLSDVEHAVAHAIARFGRLDAAHNNAGV